MVTLAVHSFLFAVYSPTRLPFGPSSSSPLSQVEISLNESRVLGGSRT